MKGKPLSVQNKLAIIFKDLGGTEYIYKSYVDEDKLQVGLSRIKDRHIANKQYRIAKIKITIEEV